MDTSDDTWLKLNHDLQIFMNTFGTNEKLMEILLSMLKSDDAVWRVCNAGLDFPSNDK